MTREVAPWRWRLFAGPADEPRSRRASEVIALVGSGLALAIIGSISQPPAGFERAVLTLIRVVPDGLDGLWQFLIDLVTIMAIGVAAASVVRRRWTVGRDLLVAFVVAAALSSLVARSVLGSWPAIWDSVRASRSVSSFAPLRLVLPGAVVLTASPHLSQPARRLGLTVVLLGLVATVLFGSASPTGATAGVLAAAMAAAIVHLIFGSPRGRPGLDDVAIALVGLKVDARALGVAVRQPAGVFVVDALDADGDRLLRDAEVGLTDFRGATVTPTETQLRTDDAQLLVTTAVAAGSDAALPAALEALGPRGWKRPCPSCSSPHSPPGSGSWCAKPASTSTSSATAPPNWPVSPRPICSGFGASPCGR